ncbi:coronatine-insensitive protein homolog 1b-like [Magnolia sinica]|uniref:coronatine-insensitive protein homolog 1b-like n=1 Tax=Magnolia sinica TaxID=86752 RepID=UPI0026593344|nr:coronatine-insensitive protein homolog 1b-like [Magnolia sinica]
MENRSFGRAMSFAIPDVALECVMAYIDDPHDRHAVSLVCRKWYNIDSLTRKHITIALCYTTTPARLRTRFPHLESLKLKGKPRAAMFSLGLTPEDWGGYVEPWVNQISESFNCLKSLNLRRMIVRDADLNVLVRSHGHMLQELMLDKCSGFSTDGLLQVTRSCRCLRTLFLEESSIVEKDGDWLHELAVKNRVLETLNFYLTELKCINITDLELIAKNCNSLLCLKISDCEIFDLAGFFRAASNLEEFGGGSFNNDEGGDIISKYSSMSFPPNLRHVGLNYMGKNEMSMLFPRASLIKKLDLQYTLLDTEDHCQLIQRCPNLEVLEVRNAIGDRGLEVVARSCNKLRGLRIENGDDEEGVVSQKGLAILAQGCPKLEYLTAYVSDITNAALESIGAFCKNLTDFRLVLLRKEERVTELPLDDGVRALLMGCRKLRRFTLYLQQGCLTDVGLGYIGKYGDNIRSMVLGSVGDSDAGLLELSKGCPKLQKLEMRSCWFSERALALAVMQLKSLKYIWVQGYKASKTGSDLLGMNRSYWNIEFIPSGQWGRIAKQPAQILAYHSLAGPRTDYPETVVSFYPSFLGA